MKLWIRDIYLGILGHNTKAAELDVLWGRVWLKGYGDADGAFSSRVDLQKYLLRHEPNS